MNLIEEQRLQFQSDFGKILMEMIKKADENIERDNEHPSCGCYSSYGSDMFHLRVSLAESYNKTVDFQKDRINPFAYEIEPLNAIHLSDTIICSQCNGEPKDQACSCFGRGYITINMLSIDGVKNYIKDKDKQEQYIKLLKKKEQKRIC